MDYENLGPSSRIDENIDYYIDDLNNYYANASFLAVLGMNSLAVANVIDGFLDRVSMDPRDLMRIKIYDLDDDVYNGYIDYRQAKANDEDYFIKKLNAYIRREYGIRPYMKKTEKSKAPLVVGVTAVASGAILMYFRNAVVDYFYFTLAGGLSDRQYNLLLTVIAVLLVGTGMGSLAYFDPIDDYKPMYDPFDELVELIKDSGVKLVTFEGLETYDDMDIFANLSEVHESLKDRGHDVSFLVSLTGDLIHNIRLNKYFDETVRIDGIRNLSIDLDKKKDYRPSLEPKEEVLIEDTGYEEADANDEVDHIEAIETEDELIASEEIESPAEITELEVIDSNEEIGRKAPPALNAEARALIEKDFNNYKNSFAADDYDKLRAYLLIKNLFTDEFENLRLGRGYIVDLTSSLDMMKDSYKRDISAGFINLNELYIGIKDEINSEKAAALSNLIPINHRVMTDNVSTMSKFFADWFEYPYDIYDIDINGKVDSYVLYQYIKTLPTIDEVRDQFLAIDDKHKADIENIYNKVHSIENEIASIGPMNFGDFIGHVGADTTYRLIYEFNESNNSYESIVANDNYELIREAIIDGNIDQDYKRFVDNLYTTDLEASDNELLARMRAGESIINLEADSPYAIIERLTKDDYDKNKVFNKSIMKTLLENQDHENIRKFVKAGMRDDRDEVLAYIDGLNGRDIVIIAFSLVDGDYEVLADIANSVDDELKRDLLYYIIYSSHAVLPEDTSATDENLVENSHLLEHAPDNQKESFLDGVKARGIEFKEVGSLDINKETAERLEKDGSFVLTPSNIMNLVRIITGEEVVEKLLYTLYTDEKFKTTAARLEGELDGFIDAYLDVLKVLRRRSESGIIFSKILNADMDIETKRRYIGYEDDILDNLLDVDPSLWDDLIDANLVRLSKENIDLYYDRHKNMDKLIKFINNNKYKSIDPADLEPYEDVLVDSVNLDNSVYAKVIRNYDGMIDEVNPSLAYAKLEKILDTDKLSLNDHNLAAILDTANRDLMVKYAANHSSDFADFIIDNDYLDNFGEDYIRALTESSVLNNKQREKLLAETNPSYDVIAEQPAASNSNIIDYKIFNNKPRGMEASLTDFATIIQNPSAFNKWSELEDLITKDTASRRNLLNLRWSKDFVVKFLENSSSEQTHAMILKNAIKTVEDISYIEDYLRASSHFEDLATIFDNKRPKANTKNKLAIAEEIAKYGIISISDESLYFRRSVYEKAK